MPTELHVFDFDGTIFDSPLDTKDNHKKFEKATGVPWLIDKEKSQELTKKLGRFVGMRRGWWGREETLQPPLVPNPAPPEWFIESTVKAFLDSKQNPDAITLIMTGRHTGLKKDVLRICADGGLVKVEKTLSKKGELFLTLVDPDVQCLFLGDDGPSPRGNKPSQTLPWKVWIVEQFLEIYPDIRQVIFWEDRAEHVAEFSELHGVLCETVIVNHVTTPE